MASPATAARGTRWSPRASGSAWASWAHECGEAEGEGQRRRGGWDGAGRGCGGGWEKEGHKEYGRCEEAVDEDCEDDDDADAEEGGESSGGSASGSGSSVTPTPAANLGREVAPTRPGARCRPRGSAARTDDDGLAYLGVELEHYDTADAGSAHGQRGVGEVVRERVRIVVRERGHIVGDAVIDICYGDTDISADASDKHSDARAPARVVLLARGGPRGGSVGTQAQIPHTGAVQALYDGAGRIPAGRRRCTTSQARAARGGVVGAAAGGDGGQGQQGQSSQQQGYTTHGAVYGPYAHAKSQANSSTRLHAHGRTSPPAAGSPGGLRF
ncbi:hypothetical protein C8J57DRAFT_1240552 [Mycena rebaudengoi]|nr:hypothetical protein C8J57DRAFT_1240552 [Mycena rebaudengoi]